MFTSSESFSFTSFSSSATKTESAGGFSAYTGISLPADQSSIFFPSLKPTPTTTTATGLTPLATGTALGGVGVPTPVVSNLSPFAISTSLVPIPTLTQQPSTLTAIMQPGETPMTGLSLMSTVSYYNRPGPGRRFVA